MLDNLINLFQFTVFFRAVLVGIMVAVCAALVGIILVLKRFSMIGDGLSHVAFGTMAVAMVAGLAPLPVSIIVVLISAFLLLKLNNSSKIKGDAMIAIISSSSLAIGVIATSLTTGFNIDINNYMFGSILTTTSSDLIISIIMTVIIIPVYIIFYNKIFAVTFDESFAKATGQRTEIFNMLIAALTAIIVVIGMRIMGALLISSLIIFPSLTSMRLFKTFRSVVISSVVVSVVTFLIGIICSFQFITPVGASIVIINLLFFILFTVFGSIIVNKRIR